MKIAQIAPLIESVPPRLYGGTERIVFWLTEELVRQGQDVTLFASADSITSAELEPCAAQALRLNPSVKDPLPYYMLMLDRVRRRADEFDVLHFHIDQLHFPLFRDIAARTLTTCTADKTFPTCRRSILDSTRCRWHPFLILSASQSHTRTSPLPSITACRWICTSRSSIHAAAMSPSSAASRRRRARIARSRSHALSGCR